MSKANDIQVGGSHYSGRETQHWDVIDRNGIGYLEGVASKYVCRHREKNGKQDVEKAQHYIMKLLEEVREHGRRPRGMASAAELKGLFVGHSLTALELGIVTMLLTWSEVHHLEAAQKDVEDLLLTYAAVPAS